MNSVWCAGRTSTRRRRTSATSPPRPAPVCRCAPPLLPCRSPESKAQAVFTRTVSRKGWVEKSVAVSTTDLIRGTWEGLTASLTTLVPPTREWSYGSVTVVLFACLVRTPSTGVSMLCTCVLYLGLFRLGQPRKRRGGGGWTQHVCGTVRHGEGRRETDGESER